MVVKSGFQKPDIFFIAKILIEKNMSSEAYGTWTCSASENHFLSNMSPALPSWPDSIPEHQVTGKRRGPVSSDLLHHGMFSSALLPWTCFACAGDTWNLSRPIRVLPSDFESKTQGHKLFHWVMNLLMLRSCLWSCLRWSWKGENRKHVQETKKQLSWLVSFCVLDVSLVYLLHIPSTA